MIPVLGTKKETQHLRMFFYSLFYQLTHYQIPDKHMERSKHAPDGDDADDADDAASPGCEEAAADDDDRNDR